jgi:hypothetical protein
MLGALLMMCASARSYPQSVVSVSDVQVGGAFAGFNMDNDGTASTSVFSGTTQIGPWVIPANAAIAALHWVKLTKNSGSDPAGSALATWLQMNADRAWSLTQVGAGTKAFSGTLQIATDAAGANVVASFSVSLSAESF